MCTVTFVPVSENNFILTSNRDETVRRGFARLPEEFSYREAKVICPIDPFSGGTWIAASAHRSLSCLLNGAFIKHLRKLPYRLSRGIEVLDSLNYQSAEEFAASYHFSEIEPFTLIMIVKERLINLHELRWDGSEIHLNSLDPHDLHIWSSVTLYSEEVISSKERIFRDALQQTEYLTPEILMDIHERYFLYQHCVDPVQQVHEIKTLSITSVENNSDTMVMRYRDLIRRELPDAVLRFEWKKR